MPTQFIITGVSSTTGVQLRIYTSGTRKVTSISLFLRQAPYGPVDVGGANFGSGANSFWPGTGSYSTFGLYADSNKEVIFFTQQPTPISLASGCITYPGR